MLIETFPVGPFDTNAYVIVCSKTNQCAIIDPGPGAFMPIKKYVEKNDFAPTSIYLTHSHWDHIGDVAVLKDHYQIPVQIHEKDAPNLRKPGTDGLSTPSDIEGAEPDIFFKDGDILQIGDSFWLVIETPGHSPGGVCFYNKQENQLIAGDTLFKQSIGNLSFPTAEPEKMWESLKKLAKLPPETRVYPGHGEETFIANETWLSRAKEVFGNL